MRRTSHMAGHVFDLFLTQVCLPNIESNEPAFLRRLRGEHGRDSMRHEHPLARPRKQKTSEDKDEEPTYVQEDSHDTISKAEYDALMKNIEVQKLENLVVVPPTRPDDLEGPRGESGKFPQDPTPLKQQMAGIGGNAKRRLAKVVGEDNGMEDSQHHVGGLINGNKFKPKKRKKVKLSFNE